jgi:hypothetical protein
MIKPFTPPSAGSKSRPPQAAERRAWVRYPSRAKSLWQIFGMRKNDLAEANVRDVSLTGLALVLSHSFPPATVLSVTIQTASGESGPHLVRLQHVRRQDDGGFLAGCTFLTELTAAELQTLVG